MLDIASLIQSTLNNASNWTETNPSIIDIAFCMDEYNPNSPNYQILIENYPDKKIWLITNIHKIEHRIKITIFIKPVKYDNDTITLFKTKFLNMKTQIDKILIENKFNISGVRNLILEGWNDKDTVRHGYDIKGDKEEPIIFSSEQFITAEYYGE